MSSTKAEPLSGSFRTTISNNLGYGFAVWLNETTVNYPVRQETLLSYSNFSLNYDIGALVIISHRSADLMIFSMATFSVTTFSIMTFSIATLSITAFIIATFSIVTLSITTLSIIAFSITITKMRQSLMTLSTMAEHCYSECRLC